MLASGALCATRAVGAVLLQGGAISCVVISLQNMGAYFNPQDQNLVSTSLLFWAAVQHVKTDVCNTQTLIHNNTSR